MIRLILFDTYEDVIGAVEVVSRLRELPGVESLEALESSISPHFCVLLETDAARDAAIGARIESALQQYADYITNVTHLAFQRMSERSDE